jgi:hypothetical protein
MNESEEKLKIYAQDLEISPAATMALATRQVQPYLGAMGIPKFLIDYPDILGRMHEDFRHDSAIAFMTFHNNSDEIWNRFDKDFDCDLWIGLKLWRNLLERLVKVSSREVALEFEQWARRHWFSGEIEPIMTDWMLILTKIVAPPEEDKLYFPLPDYLKPLIPELETLVSDEYMGMLCGYDGLEEEGTLVNELHNKWVVDQGYGNVIIQRTEFSEYEPFILDCYTDALFPDFSRVVEAIGREGVFLALRLLVNRFDPFELKMFVGFVETELESFLPGEKLRFIKHNSFSYLTADSPPVNAPSLLNEPLLEFWKKLDWF